MADSDKKEKKKLKKEIKTANIKLEEQLKRSYELRDFEIELYWKRAQYFWGFIAVIYAGYFLMITYDKHPISNELLSIVCSIGSVFSFGWYLVNRGSKKWHEHWENIINELEDKLEKPLYAKRTKLHEGIIRAGNFSVSRINIFISLIIFFSWVCLWLYPLDFNGTFDCNKIIIGFITLILLILLYFLGESKH